MLFQRPLKILNLMQNLNEGFLRHISIRCSKLKRWYLDGILPAWEKFNPQLILTSEYGLISDRIAFQTLLIYFINTEMLNTVTFGLALF